MAYFEGSIGTPSGGFNLKVEYSISQSVSGNYSDVSATGYVKRNKSSYYPYNSTSSASLNIGGNSASASPSYNLGSDGYKTIMSHSARIYHNSDGTKSITISFSFDGKLSNYYPNGSISQTITLPTIARASTVACSSPYIGDTATITISRKSSSFTHRVTYHIGELTGTIAENTKETVLSFNTSPLKEQIYALMPNAKSIAATIRCRTYSGSTKIGDTAIANFNLYAKEDECKPLLTLDVTDTNEKATELVGSNEKFIKYISKPKVVMNPIPRYSATINGHTISLGDGQYYYANSHTFDTMASNIVSGTVRDSRDYFTTTTKEVEMIDYVKLHIDSISIERTEQLSSEALLNVDGVWFNGEFSEGTSNTLVASFKYKFSGDTDWIDGGTLTPTIDGNTFTFTDISLGNVYDYDNEVQFKIIISDLLMTVGSEDKEAVTLPKGQEVVAIGEDGVWIYGDLLLNDNPIIESGSNDNGSWIKYADGTMICSGTFKVTFQLIEWSHMYTADIDNPLTFPRSFTETPVCNITNIGGYAYMISRCQCNSNGITYLSFARPNNTGTEATFDYIAMGKWK